MKAIVCKTFGLAVLGVFQEYQRFVGAEYVKLIAVPTDVPSPEAAYYIDWHFEKGLKVNIHPPSEFLDDGTWIQPHDPSLMYTVTLDLSKPYFPTWGECPSDEGLQALECARFPLSILPPDFIIGWKVNLPVLERWMYKRVIYFSSKAYIMEPRDYVNRHPGLYSFRMSHGRGQYLLFEKNEPLPSKTETLSVTEGILKMEMFGDFYECEFEFEPSQNITTVPEALYGKLEEVMSQLNYKKELDGVYQGDCNAINKEFDKYHNHYPGQSKAGILIHRDKEDGYLLSRNTFISESDGGCHIHLRNGKKKCFLGASILENYDVFVDTRKIVRSKPKAPLKIRRRKMKLDAPSQQTRHNQHI